MNIETRIAKRQDEKRRLAEENRRREEEKRARKTQELYQRLEQAAAPLRNTLNLQLYQSTRENRAVLAGHTEVMGIPINILFYEDSWKHIQVNLSTNLTSCSKPAAYLANDDNLADTLLDLLERHRERQQIREKEERYHERMLDLAATVANVAREWMALESPFLDASRVWAEEWTNRLWLPWAAWRVRYVPAFPVELDEYQPPLLHEVVVDRLQQGETYTEITMDGQLRSIIIWAPLDAREERFHERPSIEQAWRYHRHYYDARGQYVVNVPPHVVSEPPPPPQPEHLYWDEFLAQRIPRIAHNAIYLEPETLQRLSPEEILAQYGYYID